MRRLASSSALFAAGALIVASHFREVPADARLVIRPHTPTGADHAGLAALGLGEGRDGFTVVPKSNDEGHLQPLLILLHGATQRAPLFEWLSPSADSLGVVLLAVDSRDVSVDYAEFDGRHMVREADALAALRWTQQRGCARG